MYNMFISSFPFLASLAVFPLTCYVCSSSLTNNECNVNTQDCQAPLDTCMTLVDTLGNTDYSIRCTDINVSSALSLSNERLLLITCSAF